jgi:hypothetical protein
MSVNTGFFGRYEMRTRQILLLVLLCAASPKHEVYRYGEHADEAGYVVSKSGIGTNRAALTIFVSRQTRLEACGSDTVCASDIESDYQPQTVTATANCQTGDFRNFWDNITKRVVGTVTENVDGHEYKELSVSYEGFHIPVAAVNNSLPDENTFKYLCPGKFTNAAPALPDLEYPSCEDEIDEVKRTYEGAGYAHLMNQKIIDVQNIRRVGYGDLAGVACKAEVLFNIGGDGVMLYRIAPRHGQMFIEIRLATP